MIQLSIDQVHGCRPALVTFETFKDREDVLKNSKALGRSQVIKLILILL